MASVFWDAEGVLLINYVANEQIIIGEYYANLFHKVRSAKRQRKVKLGAIMIRDNATSRRSCSKHWRIVASKSCPISPPLPYSSDLAPCDYRIFPTRRGILKGRGLRLTTMSPPHSMIDELSGIILLPQSFLGLEASRDKVHQRRGDYVEKVSTVNVRTKLLPTRVENLSATLRK